MKEDSFYSNTGQADDSLTMYALVCCCKLLKWQFFKLQSSLLVSLVDAPLTCVVLTIYELSR